MPCREGDSVKECAEIDRADWECIDVVEWGRCWYCAVVRVNELECFVVTEFSEHLCNELVYCIGDGTVMGDSETEVLGIVDGIRCGLGAFVGLFIVVISVGTFVVVITNVVITWWRSLFIVVVGWVPV